MNNLYLIVPVFNVEKTLKRCLESLLSQSFKDLEIILVDDGSSDKSPKICDEYAKYDKRISVIHKLNGGLSSARNAGLKYIANKAISSKNYFVGFVDSDDWIALNTIEHCMKLIELNNADVIQFQIRETNCACQENKQPKEKIKIYSNKNEILQFYMYSTTSGIGGDYSVCQCIFNYKLLKDLFFREGKINEDIDYKYKVFSNAKKLVVTNQYFYFYWQGDTSLSFGGLKKKDFDLYEVADIIENLTSHETYGTIAFLGKVKKARTALSLLCKIAYFGISDASFEKKFLIDKLCKENRSNLKTLLSSPIPMSRKILAILFAINFNLAESCIKLFK